MEERVEEIDLNRDEEKALESAWASLDGGEPSEGPEPPKVDESPFEKKGMREWNPAAYSDGFAHGARDSAAFTDDVNNPKVAGTPDWYAYNQGYTDAQKRRKQDNLRRSRNQMNKQLPSIMRKRYVKGASVCCDPRGQEIQVGDLVSIDGFGDRGRVLNATGNGVLVSVITGGHENFKPWQLTVIGKGLKSIKPKKVTVKQQTGGTAWYVYLDGGNIAGPYQDKGEADRKAGEFRKLEEQLAKALPADVSKVTRDLEKMPLRSTASVMGIPVERRGTDEFVVNGVGPVGIANAAVLVTQEAGKGKKELEASPLKNLRRKSLAPPRIKAGFTGKKEDSAGRERCYADGKQVHCSPQEVSQEKPKASQETPDNEGGGYDRNDPEAVAKAVEERAKQNYPKYKDEYLKKGGGVFNSDGLLSSVVLNTDDWRELFPEYKGTNANVVHEASSHLNKKLFTEALTMMKGVGNNTMLVLAGGGGSGKGTAVGAFYNQEEYPIRLDQVSDNVGKLEGKIKEARDAGFNVDYVFIDRPPEDAWTNGVVKRAMNSRKKGQIARTVDLGIAFKANVEARKAAIELIKKNPDFPVTIVDNTKGFGKSRMIKDPKEAVTFLSREMDDEKQLFEKLRAETQERYESGEIPEDIAEGLLGKLFKKKGGGES